MASTQTTNSAAVLERPAPAAPGAATLSAPRGSETPQPQRKGANGADYDVVIIGSGPGGYVAAIRAVQLGLKVAIVEKSFMGGTCLNVGCIPTKAMLSSVEAIHTARNGKEFGFTAEVTPDYPAIMKRRDKIVEQLRGGVAYLMKKNAITVLNGLGRFASAHEIEVVNDGQVTQKVTTANTVIATGSVVSKPPIPGSDLEGVIDSDRLLQLPRIPKSMVVVGAGAVGLEWGDIFRELGTKITVLELMDRILPPADAEISAELAKLFQKKGMDILTGVGVKSFERKGNGLLVRYARPDGPEQTLEAENVLVATGRWPYTDGLGLEKIGLQTERRFITVNEKMETSVPGVYAIGDVTPGPALAHVASRGGEVAVENIAGHHARMDYRYVPSCVYTHPEVAWVGLTEAQARERHGEVRVGKYPFRAHGRAMAGGERDGFMKVIAEPTLGMAMEATVDEVFHTIHPHPTFSEGFLEATLDSWGRAIHKG